MPAINFTVFQDKILDGRKRQTIRVWPRLTLAERLRRVQPGDTLYLYTGQRTEFCTLLKQVRCIGVEMRIWSLIKNDEALAKADGFENAAQMRQFFDGHYDMDDGMPCYIIRW